MASIPNCDRRSKPRQRPTPQAAETVAEKTPQENQHLRPRVLRKWCLRRSMWQIAKSEHRLPSEIEQILWEELAPYLVSAPARRVV